MLTEEQLDAIHDQQDRDRQSEGNWLRAQWRQEARLLSEAIRLFQAFEGSLPRMQARVAELRDLLWEDEFGRRLPPKGMVP